MRAGVFVKVTIARDFNDDNVCLLHATEGSLDMYKYQATGNQG